MTPAAQKRIFEPYYTTKTSGENFGLGLYYCQNVMNVHEGSIRVSQLIAIVSSIIAAAALVYIRFVRKPDPAHMLVNRCAAEAQEEYKKEEP